MIFGKVWGETRFITGNKALELHAISVNEGGTCSRHRHYTKYNGFYVIAGELEVTVWRGGLVEKVVLYAGDYTEVRPQEWHQFTALEDTEAIELYWSQFESSDIERDVTEPAHA